MLTRSKARALRQAQQRDPKIPLEKSGLIEEKMFQDAVIFEDNNGVFLEGLTYAEIKKDPFKTRQLQRIKQNLPGYYSLNSRQKSKYFERISDSYLQKLSNNQPNDFDQPSCNGSRRVNLSQGKMTPQKLFIQNSDMNLMGSQNRINQSELDIEENENNITANNSFRKELPSKNVTFKANQSFKVFNKEHTPKKVRFSKEYHDESKV